MNIDELKAMDWDTISSRIDKDYLVNYKDVDWKKAPLDKFIRMCLPRDSEMGGIYTSEAIAILITCLQYKPKFILEIGTMHGTSTRLFAAIAKLLDSKVISVDGNAYADVRFNLDMLNLKDNVELIKAWSPWLNWEHKIPLDFIHFDGDHSFISVLVDYHYFNYFAKNGCIFSFHDMNIAGVNKAVEEIIKRDNLKYVSSVGRMSIYEKTTNQHEKYFQLLDVGTDRNRLENI